MRTARRFVSPRGIELAFIAALVIALLYPLARPGYLLLLDLPFGPRAFPVWRFDGTPQHLAPLWLVCAALYQVVPPEVVGKLLAVAVLGAIGLAAAPLGGTAPSRLFSIALCMVNPWVCDRLAVGQLPLLAGYAAAIVAFHAAVRAMHEPSRQSALRFGAAAAVTGMFAPHLLYVLALLFVVLGVTRLAAPGQASRRAVLEAGAIAVVCAALLSAYWLVPFLAQPSLLGRFGEGDLRAFMTRGDAALGLPFNVAAFYGFWRRVPLTKDWLPGWWLLADALLAVGAIGLVAMCRARSTRWLGLGLVMAYVLVLLVACGIGFEPTASAWRWGFEHVPGFAGLREPQKASAFLVIITALGGARALSALASSVSPRVGSALTAGALAIPLVAGAGEFAGVAGTLQPVQYPEAWYSASSFLRAQGQPGDAVLVLPWRQYSAYSFTRGATVSNPAPSFLPGTVVVSDDPQIEGLLPRPTDAHQRQLDTVMAREDASEHLGMTMAGQGIRWAFTTSGAPRLEGAPGLRLAAHWDDVALYQATGSIARTHPSSPSSAPERRAQAIGIAIEVGALLVVGAYVSSRVVAKRVATQAESAARLPST